MILNRNLTKIMNIVIKMVILGNTAEVMQANVKKVMILKQIDDRDDGSSDTFNSVASMNPISVEDLGDFIRNFSEMP